jgi:hypothetical protein
MTLDRPPAESRLAELNAELLAKRATRMEAHN